MSKINNSNIKRWLTGLILAPIILILILFCSEAIFAALVIIFILRGVWEYNKMVFGNGFIKEKIESLIFAIVIPLIVLSGNNQYLTADPGFFGIDCLYIISPVD